MGGETEVLQGLWDWVRLLACWKLKAGFKPAQLVGSRNWTKTSFPGMSFPSQGQLLLLRPTTPIKLKKGSDDWRPCCGKGCVCVCALTKEGLQSGKQMLLPEQTA